MKFSTRCRRRLASVFYAVLSDNPLLSAQAFCIVKNQFICSLRIVVVNFCHNRIHLLNYLFTSIDFVPAISSLVEMDI